MKPESQGFTLWKDRLHFSNIFLLWNAHWSGHLVLKCLANSGGEIHWLTCLPNYHKNQRRSLSIVGHCCHCLPPPWTMGRDHEVPGGLQCLPLYDNRGDEWKFFALDRVQRFQKQNTHPGCFPAKVCVFFNV